jgi:hypothetical protein
LPLHWLVPHSVWGCGTFIIERQLRSTSKLCNALAHAWLLTKIIVNLLSSLINKWTIATDFNHAEIAEKNPDFAYLQAGT